jgi:acetylornithine/N-succinyldiaminopimelate aminotransferase
MRDRSHLMTTYAEPAVTFVEGRGSVLIDDAGTEYLDFLGGLAVVSLGHARPEVTQAIEEQAGRLTHVSNLFANDVGPQVADLLDSLLRQATGQSGRVFFCNSGAEANECALKLARRASPGRFKVVSTADSFHGRTLATLAATGQPEKQVAFAPMPEGFSTVPFGDLKALAQELENDDVAAVIIEGIQAEGGVNVPHDGYLSEVSALCREHGTLLILDEVQTGLARTGDWFSFQHDHIAPDIVTLAKALGNGVPVGACWARDEVAAAFEPGDHGSTFGGQPLAMAAALATVSTMIEIDAPHLASEAGEVLRAGLLDLPGVISVRGRGLLLGAVLDAPVAREVAARALSAGLVLNAVRPDVLRLTPPLTVSADEIRRALTILSVELEATRAQGASR